MGWLMEHYQGLVLAMQALVLVVVPVAGYLIRRELVSRQEYDDHRKAMTGRLDEIDRLIHQTVTHAELTGHRDEERVWIRQIEQVVGALQQELSQHPSREDLVRLHARIDDVFAAVSGHRGEMAQMSRVVDNINSYLITRERQ